MSRVAEGRRDVAAAPATVSPAPIRVARWLGDALLAADHQRDEAVCDVTSAIGTPVATTLPSRSTVTRSAQRQHFLELVADENDRHAVGLAAVACTSNSAAASWSVIEAVGSSSK